MVGPPAQDPSDVATSRGMMALEAGTKLFYVVASSFLALFAVSLLSIAGYRLLLRILRREEVLQQTLESIGLVTIAIAVFDVAKFLAEEELVRERQLRSLIESRRSLTKFLTIIIIALSLEAIVLVFETKLERLADLLFPTALMGVAVLAVVGLGLFQWLSAHAGTNRIGGDPPCPPR